jgi:hypothetical protein
VSEYALVNFDTMVITRKGRRSQPPQRLGAKEPEAVANSKKVARKTNSKVMPKKTGKKNKVSQSTSSRSSERRVVASRPTWWYGKDDPIMVGLRAHQAWQKKTFKQVSKDISKSLKAMNEEVERWEGTPAGKTSGIGPKIEDLQRLLQQVIDDLAQEDREEWVLLGSV